MRIVVEYALFLIFYLAFWQKISQRKDTDKNI